MRKSIQQFTRRNAATKPQGYAGMFSDACVVALTSALILGPGFFLREKIMRLLNLMASSMILLFAVVFVVVYFARAASIDAQQLQEQKEIAAYAQLEEVCRLTWPTLGNRYVSCLTMGTRNEQ